MSAPLFEIEDLHVAADDGTKILNGVSLSVGRGEVHVLMGPNGSGKSTLASALLGSPEYRITGGSIVFRGDDITDWSADVRAKVGLFLAFQYPQEFPGVSVLDFLRQATHARTGEEVSVLDLRKSMLGWMDRLGMDSSFGDRYLNEGLSDGDKRRNEILQMALLRPEMAVLDETGSSLDVDALKVLAHGVQEIREDHTEMGVLVITREPRLLDHLRPDHAHILREGRIVDSGGLELVESVEAVGYEGSR